MRWGGSPAEGRCRRDRVVTRSSSTGTGQREIRCIDFELAQGGPHCLFRSRFSSAPTEEFMSKELVVSSNRHETRVAVLEDDLLTEIYFQRQQEYSLAGSIHKGRVTRVLPGMQSAFVDIGLERDAFLYVSDFFEDNEEYDQVVSNVEEQVLRLEKAQPTARVARAEPIPELGLEPPGVVNGAAPPLERPMGAPAPDRDGRERRGRRPRR